MSAVIKGGSLGSKQSRLCYLSHNTAITADIFRMDFDWPDPAPRAGQFFMLKPLRSGIFLGRPISVAQWEGSRLCFFITRRGKGTQELALMRPGEQAELIGPLGNAWEHFLPAPPAPIALIGGGIGIAPLNALLSNPPASGYVFDLYAGFRTGFRNAAEKEELLGAALKKSRTAVIAAEDIVVPSGGGGKYGEHKGRITDFFDPHTYAAVCACGPQAMLKAVAEKCAAAAVPCFVSMERRMACGVGACLGCTVATAHGNRRCCADGPVFPAHDIIFDRGDLA